MQFITERMSLAARWFYLLCSLASGCATLSSTPPMPDAAFVPQAAQPSRTVDKPRNNGVTLLSYAQASPPTTTLHGAPPFTAQAELNIETLIEQVLARNPSLSQMDAAWQAAAARYPQVRSLDDPMFAAVLAPTSIGSNAVEFGGRLEISQKFPFPGKLALRGQTALAEASAAGHDVEDMRVQLVEAARLAFYEYYLVARAIEVNEESLRLLRRFRQSAEDRYKTGLVSEQDILQADVEVGRQRERGIMLERMRKVAVARINTLLNSPPATGLPPPPRELPMPESPPSVESLRDYALAQRPDLKAGADRIAAEQSSLSLAYREYYPDVEASAAYDSIMGNGTTRDLAPQVGLRLNVPVRCARRNAAVSEAEARIAQRRAELASRTNQVAFQVQEAYEQLGESLQTLKLYNETILPAAQKNVQAAQSAYVTGKIQFLSLVEAQRNLVGLRDRYYEATADYFRRRANLERVIGGPLTLPKPLVHDILPK